MKANPQPQWSVGELAKRFGLETHVLRHWEDEGLLQPARDTSGYRRYGPDDVTRVAVILRNKAAGMTLDQVRVLLDGGAANRHEVLEAHLRDLAERAEAIERSREMTEHGSPGLPTLRGQGVAVGAETPRPPSETTAFEEVARA